MFDTAAPCIEVDPIDSNDSPPAASNVESSLDAGCADLSGVPLPELESRITELAGHLNAAEHRFLVLLAEFDRREGWADGATRSCAHWLSWKCGIELGTARERVRVARALAGLPRIDAAMARGALCYSKARALTRVATPETEETLLMIALHGTANHVESVVRGVRRVQQVALLEREARQQANRGLTWHWDDDGTLHLKACLPAEDGAVVLRALQRALDDEDRAARSGRGVPAEDSADRHCGVRGSDVSAETFEVRASDEAPPDVPAGTSAGRFRTVAVEPVASFAQRRADALVRFAESWLAHGEAALAGGDRHQIVVHVDARTLVADTDGRSELDEQGPALAAETVRRLGCDATLLAIVEDGRGGVLDVGRKTRSIPPAIARALTVRDRGCRYPGCTRHRHVDAHHIEHWAHGGATRLSNLVLLCRRHHRHVHEGGVTVRRLDDGALVFTDAAGRRIEAAPPTVGHAAAIGAHHRRHGPPIDADTAVTRWCGESLDLGLAVAGLCESQQRAVQARASP
jgi:hypothetical protein